MRVFGMIAACIVLAAASLPAAHAEKKYGPGVTDTEIKIGQTMPYSGPASSYGVVGKATTAYFKMLNAQGGINGRKINFISLDDSYSPPKAVEQTRRLVEKDEVLAIVGNVGTPSNTAIHKYLNQRKVPHLLIATGAAKWDDPKNFPWTTPFYQPYEQEAAIEAKHMLKANPNAKIAVIYQNDDFGKDYLKGFKQGLGANVGKIVKEVSYEITDATVESQLIDLKASGADTLFTIATPKFAAQAIRKVADLGWKPAHYIVAVSSSHGQVLTPAGLDNAKGLMTAMTLKLVGDPSWDESPDMKAYLKFLKEWLPEINPLDSSAVLGYVVGHVLTHALKNAGDDLTRENLLKQATSIDNQAFPMLLPGVTITTTPEHYAPFKVFRNARFDGTRWVLVGDPIRID